MTLVRIEKRDRIAIVAFDRGSPANPLSLQLLRELTAAADTFADDTSTGAVILTGRPDNFTMGFDLKDAEYAGLRRAGIARQHAGLKIGTRMCRAWQEIPALTVSAIEGWCVGGGIALAVATDLRVVGEHARCYVPEIERGMNMSWGSVPRIVNLVGPARAKRIVLLAEKLDARQALEWGLADKVAADGTTAEAALAFAERAASLPPIAMRMCKQDIDAYANALAPASSHADLDQYMLAQQSEDFMEALDAFLAKRDAKFTGN